MTNVDEQTQSEGNGEIKWVLFKPEMDKSIVIDHLSTYILELQDGRFMFEHIDEPLESQRKFRLIYCNATESVVSFYPKTDSAVAVGNISKILSNLDEIKTAQELPLELNQGLESMLNALDNGKTKRVNYLLIPDYQRNLDGLT